MVSLDLRYQLAIVLVGVALFWLLLVTGLYYRLLGWKSLSRFRKQEGVVFFVLNFCGLATTNLLSMNYLHLIEQLVLIFVFLYELIFRLPSLPLLFHHVLAIVGLALQIHIGIGGAMISYLVIDQVTNLIQDVKTFWITFFVVRLLAYNVVMFIAVRQAVGPARESKAVMGWFVCVVIWWVFSLLYHLQYVWRERKEIISTFFNQQQADKKD